MSFLTNHQWLLWTALILLALAGAWNWLAAHQSRIRFLEPTSFTMDDLELTTLASVALLAYKSRSTYTEDRWRHKLATRLSAAGCPIDLDVDSIEFHQSSGINAYSVLSADGSRMFVGVRGTQGLFDVLTDLRFFPRRISYGWGHRGGAEAAARIYGSLGLRQRMKDQPNTSVLIAGHSLGALICSGLLALNEEDANSPDGPNPIHGALLICSPRFCGWRLAQRMNAALSHRVVRVSCCRDIVALVPFRCLGFAHFSADNYYDRRGDLHKKVSLLYRAFDGLMSGFADFRRGRLLTNMIGYHNCKRAVKLIQRDATRF